MRTLIIKNIYILINYIILLKTNESKTAFGPFSSSLRDIWRRWRIAVMTKTIYRRGTMT
jgi:hypothetical protein